ncbi:ABC transporter substrate-binding protein [Mycobacteroides chelonae]|nr:ABC transporter substrate-binding protein [Mycobacteroides chelonae]
MRFLADPLVDFEPDTGALRPAAARSWAVDPDGRRVVFELREGVRFHHGRTVVASDYVFALSRAVDPRTGSKLAYHLAVIEGYDEVRSGAATTLRGVSALDDTRLEIRLTEPFHEIAAVFGHRMTSAVPHELISGDAAHFAAAPVSTGPYRVTSPWQHGAGLRLERFESYYGLNGAHSDGGAGHVAAIEFVIYDDIEDAYASWHDGRLDITKVPPGRIAEAEALGEQFRKTPCALMQYIGLPTEVPPFDDPRVRRAIGLAIDRRSILDDVFLGTRPIAQRIIPPILSDDDDADLTGVKHDPAEARRLLKEAGVTHSVTTSFRYNAGLGHDGWVERVLDDINLALGWSLTPQPMEWRDFLVWLGEANEPFRMTWAIDYPSVDNFLYPLLHSRSIGDDNFTRYRSAQFDRQIDIARATASHEARVAAYTAAERIACRDLPLIPLWFGVQYHAVQNRDLLMPEVPVDIFGEPALRSFRFRVGHSEATQSGLGTR